MSLFTRVVKYITNWQQSSSLLNEPDATAVPQSWHHFDQDQSTWAPITPSTPSTLPTPDDDKDTDDERTNKEDNPHLTLITWNVDAIASHLDSRILGILSAVRTHSPQPDILFFQEVSKPALASILRHPWIREEDWYSSEGGATQWAGQQFATITLLSRRTFTHTDDISRFRLGQIWRVEYPSRFGRDALCCDIFARDVMNARVRLVNVHLDSLPIHPSLRPRQLAIVAKMLHAAGRGVVAGDFQPCFAW